MGERFEKTSIRILMLIIVALVSMNLYFLQRTIEKIDLIANDLVSLKIKVAILESIISKNKE